MAADDIAPLLALLLTAARTWSRHEPLDIAAADEIRFEALRRAHRRYVRRLPVYRRLAEDQGLGGPASVAAIVDELMITSDVFKSYDPRWLEDRSFDRMTQWLGDRFTRAPSASLDGVTSVAEWRRRLARDEVFLTLSTGTSGRLSFVPRDGETLQALTSNGAFTIPPLWDGDDEDVDCLVLGPAGRGKGMEVVTRAVARSVRRSHLLSGTDADAEPDEAAWDAALQFLRRSAREQRRVLVFGTPGHVEQACQRLAGGRPLRLAAGSVVLTGGGRKGAQPADGVALRDRIADELGVDGRQQVDAYSAAELNFVLMTCAYGRYHVPPTVEAVVLDDALMQIDAEEAAGTLGFLDPFALSYPGFIVPGDRALLSRLPCRCGLLGPSIVGEIVRAAGFEARGCAGVATATLG